LCVTNIKSKYIICKIGYTTDIVAKLKSLKQKYNCEIFLSDIYYIYSKEIEKEFNKCMREVYPELIYSYTISEIKKNNLYYYHPKLHNEFEVLNPQYNNRTQFIHKLLSILSNVQNA
jgi:hypothetical protein